MHFLSTTFSSTFYPPTVAHRYLASFPNTSPSRPKFAAILQRTVGSVWSQHACSLHQQRHSVGGLSAIALPNTHHTTQHFQNSPGQFTVCVPFWWLQNDKSILISSLWHKQVSQRSRGSERRACLSPWPLCERPHLLQCWSIHGAVQTDWRDPMLHPSPIQSASCQFISHERHTLSEGSLTLPEWTFTFTPRHLECTPAPPHTL